MKVIIAAAGTGGHINPGIAIADIIEKENPGSDIRFIATGKKDINHMLLKLMVLVKK